MACCTNLKLLRTMKIVFRIIMKLSIHLCELGDKSSEMFEALHNLIAEA